MLFKEKDNQAVLHFNDTLGIQDVIKQSTLILLHSMLIIYILILIFVKVEGHLFAKHV